MTNESYVTKLISHATTTTSIEGNVKHNANLANFNQTMINQLDLSFEEKKDIVIKSGRIPSGTGVNFKYFAEPELDKIIRQLGDELTENKARFSGLVEETLTKFKDHIKSNRYSFTYEQPVVVELPNGLYKLICGEHRYTAHLLAGRKTMFVAVVEFDSLVDQIFFQSNENGEDDEYVKAPRTTNDVIGTLDRLVKEGFIDINDDKSINSSLIRLNQKTSEFPSLRDKLRACHGIINPVKSYNDETRKEWTQKYKPEVQFSCRSNIVPVDGVAYLNKTFKGGSGKGGVKDLDYDPRAFFDACYLLQNNKVNKVDVVCSVNGAGSDKLSKIRNYKKESMMQDMLNRCIKIVDDYRSGKYDPVKDVSFNFLPQIDSVDTMEEWV